MSAAAAAAAAAYLLQQRSRSSYNAIMNAASAARNNQEKEPIQRSGADNYDLGNWRKRDKDDLEYAHLCNKLWKKEKEFEKRTLMKIIELVRSEHDHEEVTQKVIGFFNECGKIKELKWFAKPGGMVEALIAIKFIAIDHEKYNIKLKKKDIKRIKCVIDSAIHILRNRPKKKKRK
jgi:hypothetical protein